MKAAAKCILKHQRGRISSAVLHFCRTEKESEKAKRLEKHYGSNSESHRSAVKGQQSWQQRYEATMVNHSHTSFSTMPDRASDSEILIHLFADLGGFVPTPPRAAYSHSFFQHDAFLQLRPVYLASSQIQ